MKLANYKHAAAEMKSERIGKTKKNNERKLCQSNFRQSSGWFGENSHRKVFVSH